MSLYDRKLEKLEDLAGLAECAHARCLEMQSPTWFTPEGEEPTIVLRQCLECGTMLSNKAQARDER
jgi:hypothetical protein